jgi:NAD(P)-dependent dehydrogenase (short-subunit alcohol dehydrogenase family)
VYAKGVSDGYRVHHWQHGWARPRGRAIGGAARRSAHRAATIAELTSRSSGIVIGDLRSAADTRSIADQVDAIGRMDAVIHNAGIYGERSRASTPEGHAGTLAVNALAPYMLTA